MPAHRPASPKSAQTLVVSLNPAVDCEWVVESFRPVEKNEVLSERRWPGGKGINVARWLRWLGANPHLFLPVGGAPGEELVTGVTSERIPTTPFPLKESSRVNVIVTQKGGGPQYRLNPLWPRFSASEQRRVVQAVRRAIEATSILVLSGALPRSMKPETYAQLVKHGRRCGRPVVLDCDGEAFRLAAPEQPFLVKPNESELEQWAGRALGNDESILDAARRLSATTRHWVLVSLGERGAMLINSSTGVELRQSAPRVTVRNTVGAGDAMLAAAVDAVSRGLPPVEWLKRAVATGTAATQVPPGELPVRKRRT